jgi:hypothetical protein
MRIPILFLFLIASSFYYSQTTLSNDTLIWRSARPLAWNDFKGEIIDGIGLNGEIFCMNLANFERKNSLSKTSFTVTSVFDRNKSWTDSKLKNGQGLVYFQCVFDIYEVHARNLRKIFLETDFGKDPNQLFQKLYNESLTNLTMEFNQLRKETKMGSLIKELNRWRVKLDDELTQLDAYKN